MLALGMIIGVIFGFVLGFYVCTLMVMKDRKELKRIMETALEKERKTGKWNVITKCPMDADEIAAWSERLGYEIPADEAYMYGNLPEEGEDVLVCTASGTIFIDSLCRDEGCYFEDYGEMDGIVAWMPLPEPYKEADE